MGTPQEDESTFAILVAGDTPSNLHQDKLGEYVRTGGTKNGRPAFLKDNDTNHMLWFAHGADGPTWYVGKREEFGESRGWLQVKSDAMTPQDIKGTWQVWSTTEKMWKNCKEGDIKCVSVSATCGVIIVGATPNNLLQDKLGEYRRVQLRVITGRGVYEMVGMPNVMMWYSPGGTWNIGKRDELGQNRGWYQAVSKAISPEGITNWQVWDGANKRWEKAPELQAISVGSRRIAFTGATPNDIGSDKLEEYVRKGFKFCDGRAVYECVNSPERCLWYAAPYWYVGPTKDLGKAQGWLCCHDDAPCPEHVREKWRVGHGQQMIDAPDIKCIPVGAIHVMVAGDTPNSLNSDKLGEFIRQVGRAINNRPVYSQVGNDERMLWYAGGYWYLGRKAEMGKPQGWMCVRDPAPAPELVQQIWRVGDGHSLHDAINVKCAAIGARCIEVLGITPNGLHKDKMGEFQMLAAQEVNGKPVYEKDPSTMPMVWASNGYWYVGKRDELGKQAGWMQVRDSASLPENITGTWQVWNQADGKWMAAEGVKVLAVGNAQVNVSGVTPAACNMHTDKLGDFVRLKGQEVNGTALYRRKDSDVRLWQASGNWYIGPASKAGKMAGWWRCRDGARIPEQVKGCWEVGDGKEWHRAEHVRCTEFVMPRLMLKGGTPDDRHQDKLGTYLLCEGELVNDRTCYAQHGNPSRMCWFLTPYWYVGKREEKGLGQGWLQARSLAHHPEQIASVWSVWRSADKKWVQAPDVKVQADGVAKAVLRPGAELEPRVPLAGGEAAAGGDGGAVGGGDGISDATLMVAEDNPQMAISPQAALDSARFDVFLSHDWGEDCEGRATHARISLVNQYLESMGLRTCFDEEPMQGNVLDRMCGGIDDAECVVVFVTQNYLEKVGGVNGPQDQCKKEFEYAERTKGADKLISVVMEPSVRKSDQWLRVRKSDQWRGSVGMVLGSRLFRDLSADEGQPGWQAGLTALHEEILLVKGTDPEAVALQAQRSAAVAAAVAHTPLTHGQGRAVATPVATASAPSASVSSAPSASASAAPSTSASAAPSPPGGPRRLSMAQKVLRIKEELSLEPALPIARAVAEANEAMGIEPAGSMAAQVELLLSELGVS